MKRIRKNKRKVKHWFNIRNRLRAYLIIIGHTELINCKQYIDVLNDMVRQKVSEEQDIIYIRQQNKPIQKQHNNIFYARKRIKANTFFTRFENLSIKHDFYRQKDFFNKGMLKSL